MLICIGIGGPQVDRGALGMTGLISDRKVAFITTTKSKTFVGDNKENEGFLL